MSIRLFSDPVPTTKEQPDQIPNNIYPARVYSGIQDGKLLTPKTPRLSSIHRLVVWVSPGELDEPGLAESLWQLAIPKGLQILLVGHANTPETESRMHQRLVTLQGFLTDIRIRVSISMTTDRDWLAKLASLIHHDDLLIVCQEQYDPDSHLMPRSLGKLLCYKLDMPVYLLSGYLKQSSPWQYRWLREFSAWTTSIALILIFGGVQISLQRAYTGTLANLVLGSSIVVEFISLLKLNELIG